MMGTLRFGAEQAVRNCLHVERGEKVVLITDRDTIEIGRAIEDVLRDVGSLVTTFVLEDYGPRSTDGVAPLPLPAAILDALKDASVSVYAASGKRGELSTLRAPLLSAVDANPRLRHAHMINITRQVMEQGMSADYAAIQKLSAQVHNVVKDARRIRVTSPAGTDFVAEFNPNWKWIVSDGEITPAQWKNLPDGEVFTCAQTANGRAVIDGCLGDYFSELGTCEAFPVTIDMTDGVVSKITCPARPKLEEELREYARQDANANRVGEFAVGTNIGLTGLIGNLLQDEKFPGVHIALGHGYPEKTGSPWASSAHLDVVMRNVTIDVDGRTIMDEGRFVL